MLRDVGSELTGHTAPRSPTTVHRTRKGKRGGDGGEETEKHAGSAHSERGRMVQVLLSVSLYLSKIRSLVPQEMSQHQNCKRCPLYQFI